MAGTCLTRALSTLQRGCFSLAEQDETTFPHRLRDAHGMRACNIACRSPLRDAKLQMALHLCASGEQKRLQKEQPGRRLRSSHECKATYFRKGGGKAMKSDGKRQGIGGTSVTGETLIPRETPMRTLSSGLSLWRFAVLFLLLLKRIGRKYDRL